MEEMGNERSWPRRSQRPARLAGMVVLLLLAAGPLVAKEAETGTGARPGTLQGVVVASGAVDLPVPGAAVSLVELQRRTLTDRGGRFRFANVPAGRYTLRVSTPGFAVREQQVEVGGGGVEEMAIELEPVVFEVAEVIATASPVGSVGYQAAQAFGRDALQRRAATSIGEMLDGEPGLAMRSFGSATARPVIRGLDGDRVLVLENGERMGDLQETAADHAISLDPLATDRIEVVRGPASLLYGSSALGGVVNLFNDDLPRDWSPGTSGNVAVQGATVNGLGAGFGRFLHGDDRWAAVGRASYRDAGNLMTPEGRLPGTYSTVVAGAVGLGYRGSSIEGGLSAGFHDNSYGIPEEIDDPTQDVDVRMARQTLQGRAAWRSGGFVEQLEVRLNASRFDQQEVGVERLADGSVVESLDVEFGQQTLSSTVTARHAPRGWFDAGATGFSLFARALEVGGNEAFTPGASSVSLAVFTFQEIPVGSWIRLQIGGRLETQRMRPLTSERFPGVGGERVTQNVSGALGLNLRPLQGLEFGAQLARANRIPSVEELYADGPHLGAGAYEIGDPALAPETAHGLDAFGRWTTARSRLEIAGFVNRISNFVVFQPTGEIDVRSGLPVFRREGDAVLLFGGEAALEALLTDRLRARIGADYVQGSRRDDESTPLPVIPPLRGRVGLTYSPARAWFGGEARLVAGQDRVAVEEEPTAGYTLLALDGGYRLGGTGRHVLTLRLDNVLNAAYRDHLSRVEDRHFPMPGRNLNVVYRWMF
jgi:iron complex outermembrane recepter protein